MSRRHANQQGSVLIVCLALLAMMALMATAFLSSVQLQRGAAKNYRELAMAEMAALSGRERVISYLKQIPGGGSNVEVGGGWQTTFMDSTNGVVADMWRHAGIDNIADAANDTYFAYNAKGGATLNDLKSRWYEVCFYNRKLNEISAVQDIEHPLVMRYAVATLDLHGCLLMKGTSGNEDLAGGIFSTAVSADETTTKSIYLGTKAPFSTPAYSWDHIRAMYGNLPSRSLILTTPFSNSGPLGKEIAINVNTVPLKLLQGYYSYVKTQLGSPGGSQDPATWVGKVKGARPFGTVADISDYATDPVVAAMADTTNGDYPTYGGLFVGESRFFRVSLRGQLYDKALAKPLAEANMEVVVFVDGARDQILYQRWIDRRR